LKIVLLSDWFLPRLGGVELQLRDLADQLAARGHRVDVVTATPADPGVQGPLRNVEAPPPGVAVHRLGVPLLPGLGVTFAPSTGTVAREVLHALDPDVLHVHAGIGTTTALAGLWAGNALALPTAVTFHSVLGPHRHLLRAFDVALGWTRWPHVFSAVSGTVAREIAWLVPGRAVEVLPNGVERGDWIAEPVPGPHGELRLISVMRFAPRKRGVALLRVVAAAAAALAGVRRVTLTLIGDGPQRARLEREARRLGIADRVEFTGCLSRPAIRERFARADAFVLVSVLESFGIAALEARAAGLPIVARGDTGMAELLVQGTEALLAPSDGGVVEHLVRLGTDARLRQRIAHHNRTVPPAVSWAGTVARHLEIYERARAGWASGSGGASAPGSRTVPGKARGPAAA
jgi:glycosyltransferase involved in cell wall biosynthesis